MSMTERTGNNVTGVSKDFRRIAIILCYDKDGIVDDYIPYFLDEFRRFLEVLVIVCNGKLCEEGNGKHCKK